MDSSKLKVAVLMATYNRSTVVNGLPLVERAIHSFLNQDYANSHLYILNDASTDNTQMILAKYEGHPRITIFHGTENKLPPNNWNWLWSQVHIKMEDTLICQLHDDDEMTVDSISKRVSLFESDSELSVVYGGVIAQNLEKTGETIFLGQPVDIDRIWKEEYINFTTLMYRSYLYFHFDPDLRYYFDWLFKIQCLTDYKCAFTPDPVMRYTTHHGQETNKCRRENMNAQEEKVMREKLTQIYK